MDVCLFFATFWFLIFRYYGKDKHKMCYFGEPFVYVLCTEGISSFYENSLLLA
jgi:hypothetical protein